jgi:protein TonB
MSYDDSGMDVSAADRLGMTLFFAAVLHAAAVLGISFELNPRLPANQSVEITLAQYDDEEAPKKADFLAQTNQQGSGTEAEKKEITSPSPDNQGVRAADVIARPHAAAAERVNPLKQQPVVSSLKAERLQAAAENSEVKTKPVSEQVAENPSLLQQSLEIASLEARFLEQRQAYAKRPRVTRLTSVSARKTSSAYYMDSWRKELERIGNINYPEEARRRQLKGRVRVMVALEPDGRVSAIEIMESSGHKILDDAVTRIIRLAEPFAPFSDEMRLEMDRLEIIRTFDFGSRLSSF